MVALPVSKYVIDRWRAHGARLGAPGHQQPDADPALHTVHLAQDSPISCWSLRNLEI